MKLFVAWALLGMIFSLRAAAETARTAKDTDLQREPFAAAATLAALPGQTVSGRFLKFAPLAGN